ncbi:MAG: membrane protein insertase YidC [Lachnospiraceae bacterium]|nr:membrane protein insertase YidC [Lachnospiraceae bacterium]
MSFFHMLYQLIIGPLELILETVYGAAQLLFASPGVSIIAMSLVMNLLLLPLYKSADAIQAGQREKEKSLAAWVSHIRKTFKGDERYMMLQTYYRQNDYKPFHVLKGMLPLLLEIPFFIAAYHFLSNLQEIRGTAFGPIADLGSPDNLLTIGTLTLHLLPVLMTLINFISSAVYTRGFPLKDKLTLYGMAVLFLVLLYESPAGLVLYWTLNNLFSLVKNVVQKIAELIRKKIKARKDRREAVVARTAAMLGGAPAAAPEAGKSKAPAALPKGLFSLGCLFLTLLTGVLIPSTLVLASPSEFVLISNFRSPLIHVFTAFLLAAGLFLLWFGIFYYLAGPKGKKIFACLIWLLSGGAVVNYMFFGTELGNMSAELKFDVTPEFLPKERLLNFGILLGLAALMLLIWIKGKKLVRGLYIVLILAISGMAGMNLIDTQKQLPQIRSAVYNVPDELAHFTISKNGKNVIVIFMDRAVGALVPYLFQEKPELAQQFEGFTFYPNTLSFGPVTNIASPALFGGYDYTPERMNARDTVKISKKHDEALKLMPVTFYNEGYDVTLCDPTYANYSWYPDLSAFDDYPGMHTYITAEGQFADFGKEGQGVRMTGIWERNFFCYSLMKTAPVAVQPFLYQGGTYFKAEAVEEVTQRWYGMSVAKGLHQPFLNAYSVLCSLPAMSRISDGDENTFMMMVNYTAHEPNLLQEPQYEPAQEVNNLLYDANQSRFTYNGRTLRVEKITQMAHYQVNMAALMRLGIWMDFLKESGVYDNCRIIIVSDHGRDLGLLDEMKFGSENYEDVMTYNPLLMVKDFNVPKEPCVTDDTFMTNADTPLLAFEGLIEDPVNPLTGLPVTDELKYETEQHVFFSDIYSTVKNNGTVFLPGTWLVMEGEDIFDMSRWRTVGETPDFSSGAKGQ